MEKDPVLVYREHATFYTDSYQAYKGVIPQEQHKAISKKARKTNRVERFNCTLRQRVSRLVRSALSFSKKLANHIGAIKYFISHYNLLFITDSVDGVSSRSSRPRRASSPTSSQRSVCH